MNLETVGWKEAADGVSNPTADEMLIAKKMERICGRCGADWSLKIKTVEAACAENRPGFTLSH